MAGHSAPEVSPTGPLRAVTASLDARVFGLEGSSVMFVSANSCSVSEEKSCFRSQARGRIDVRPAFDEEEENQLETISSSSSVPVLPDCMLAPAINRICPDFVVS